MSDTDNIASWETLSDQMEIAGRHLIETVSGLISRGNVRTLRIKKKETGQVFLEIPPATCAAVSGVAGPTAGA